jgi:hypothetical protein
VIRRNVLRWLALTGVAACAGCGQDTGPPTTAKAPAARSPGIATADDLVRQVAKFYGTLRAVHVQVSQATMKEAASPEAESSFELWVERPANLAARDPRGEAREWISNRSAHFEIFRSRQEYVQGESWGTLDRLALNPAPLHAGGWGLMFGPAFMCEDPYQAIMAGVDTIEYLGLEVVADVAAHRILFEQSNLVWEMWIAAKGDPLVVRLEFDRPPTADADGPAESRIRIEFRDWVLNPSIPPGTFEFDPPDSFSRLLDKPTPEAN